MTGWVAYGLERCLKCRELRTYNHIWFPLLFQGNTIMEIHAICRECLEEPLTEDSVEERKDE
jgi:hypothetical protein